MNSLEIIIAPGNAVPIFRQVVDQIRLAAATGQLKAGDPLPSVRALAERLVVNPNTIAKAYNELSRDGVIETQQGRGAFIAKPRQIYTKSERMRRISPHVDSLVNEALSLGFSREEITDLIQSRFDGIAKSTAGRIA